MRSIQAVFKTIKDTEDVTDILAFGRAVMGRKYVRDTILRNFWLVSPKEYTKTDKTKLINHFNRLSCGGLMYIPITTGKTHYIRGSRKYTEWRNKVIKRDGYFCQECGRKTSFPEVDHIYPLCAIIAENRITNLKQSLECKSLWDSNNGRVLCKGCHKLTDTYGIRASTYTPEA